MAKRRQRRSKRRKRPNLFLIAVLALLAAGFLTRRMLAPRALHFLTHRSASPSSEHKLLGQGPPARQAPGEALTESERRTLDQIVRERSR